MTSAFSPLSPLPPDALLGLMTAFREDDRAEKFDLGVGVYKDANGVTPVMRASRRGVLQGSHSAAAVWAERREDRGKQEGMTRARSKGRRAAIDILLVMYFLER